MLAITLATRFPRSARRRTRKRPLPPTPEARAVAFLSRRGAAMVAREPLFLLPQQRRCRPRRSSGRRRLVTDVPGEALADTTAWLRKPAGWDHNGGEGPFSDKRLARVAFTAPWRPPFRPARQNDKSGLASGRPSSRATRLPTDRGGSKEKTRRARRRPTDDRSPRFSHARAWPQPSPVRFKPRSSEPNAWLQKQDVQNVTDASVSLLASAAAKRRAAGRGTKTLPRAPLARPGQ